MPPNTRQITMIMLAVAIVNSLVEAPRVGTDYAIHYGHQYGTATSKVAGVTIISTLLKSCGPGWTGRQPILEGQR